MNPANDGDRVLFETMGLGLRHWSPAERLVDHWQELERHVAAPAPSMVNLSDPAAPRSLLASYTSHDGQHSRWIYHPAELSAAKYTGVLSAHQTTLLERHSTVAAGRGAAAPSTAERRITGRP
ncbi:hypothetical protein VDR56_016765 [Xanthomonas campestris pv. campestris]|nr:hypothetical protein VDP59_016440 [Xanthomonas campestris pv. campestris]